MTDFAIVNNDIVDNVIVAESLALVEILLPGEQVVEVTEATGFAYIGAPYDSAVGKFVPPQPFPSWKFVKKSWIWEAPAAYPTDGKNYVWREDEGWIEIVLPPDVAAASPAE